MRRKSYALARETPKEAAAEAELMDYDFHLFTERLTGQDSVICRTGAATGCSWPARGRATSAPSTRRSPSARRRHRAWR